MVLAQSTMAGCGHSGDSGISLNEDRGESTKDGRKMVRRSGATDGALKLGENAEVGVLRGAAGCSPRTFMLFRRLLRRLARRYKV